MILPTSGQTILRRLTLVCCGLGLIAVVLGQRWNLISDWGTDIPQHDQWQVEPGQLYVPWNQGLILTAELFRPHNEHRIVLTRLWNLGLFALNHQWDGQLQMTANALLAAAIAALLFQILRKGYSGLLLVIVAGGFAVVYGSNLLYENTLWGFQSQVYFLILFALLHFWGCLGHRPGSMRWWLGFAAGLFGLGSMASGFVAPAITAIATAWGGQPDSASNRRWPRTVALGCLALLGIGAGVIGHPVGTEGWTLSAALRTGWLLLAFPAREGAATAIALVTWLPLICFLFGRLRQRGTRTFEHRYLLAIGLWCFLQLGLTAVGRPQATGVLPNRYMDIAAVGLVANLAMLGAGWGAASSLRSRIAWIGLGAVWLAGVGFAAFSTVQLHTRYVGPGLQAQYQEQGERVRTFLSSNDPQVLQEVPYPRVPAAVPDLLVFALRHPEMRAILPASIHPPLPFNFPGHPEMPNGLPVSVPHQPAVLNQGTWTKEQGAAAWVDALSTPLTVPPGSLLRLHVVGQLSAGAVELHLKPKAATASPTVLAQHSSHVQVPVDLPVASSPFNLAVIDHSSTDWMGLSRAVPLGLWSHRANRLRAQGSLLQRTGAGFLVLAALLTLASHLSARTATGQSRHNPSRTA